MDNQNNPGGSAPSEPAVEPTTEPAAPMPEPSAPAEVPTAAPSTEPAPAAQSQPQQEEKCVTCGGPASGGVCTACGKGEITCTCQPATSGQSGPTEVGGGAPTV